MRRRWPPSVRPIASSSSIRRIGGPRARRCRPGAARRSPRVSRHHRVRSAAAERAAHRRWLAERHAIAADRPWLLAVAMMRPGDKLASYRIMGESPRRSPNATGGSPGRGRRAGRRRSPGRIAPAWDRARRLSRPVPGGRISPPLRRGGSALLAGGQRGLWHGALGSPGVRPPGRGRRCWRRARHRRAWRHRIAAPPGMPGAGEALAVPSTSPRAEPPWARLPSTGRSGFTTSLRPRAFLATL